MAWFKVLHKGCAPGIGGAKATRYSLPKNGKPGEWMDLGDKAQIKKCCKGYHLTNNPLNYMSSCNDRDIYVAEYDKSKKVDGLSQIRNGEDKIACQKVRLLRKATTKDLKKFNIYVDCEVDIDGERKTFVNKTIYIRNCTGLVKNVSNVRVKVSDSNIVVLNCTNHFEIYGKTKTINMDKNAISGTLTVNGIEPNKVTAEFCKQLLKAVR